MLRDLVRDGTTVILTTQYLEEADRLADDIVVLDHGRTVAHGTPDELKARIGDDRIDVTVATASELVAAAGALSAFVAGEPSIDERPCSSSPRRSRAGTRLIDLVRALDDAGIDAVDVDRRQATLDDVFLTLTTVRPRRRREPRMTATLTPATEPATTSGSAASGSLFSESIVFARRHVEHIRQLPEKLLDVTLQPLMFVLLFAYVFGGAIGVEGGSYREYLIGGILIQTLAFGMVGPAMSIATDLTEGVIDRFRSLPVRRTAYLVGH